MTYKPAPEVISEITAATATALGQVIQYDYGSAVEITNRLKIKSDGLDYDKKYPLVWYLIQDNVEENIVYGRASKRKVENITIVICSQSDNQYSSKDRYDNNIIPILRPIYDEFMRQLKKSKLVTSTKDKFSHKYIENLFWGRDGLYGHEGNIFDDYIDAILINNLNLFIINTC